MRETMHEKAARLRVVIRDGRTLVVGDHGQYEIVNGECSCTVARYGRACSHAIAAEMYRMGGVA